MQLGCEPNDEISQSNGLLVSPTVGMVAWEARGTLPVNVMYTLPEAVDPPVTAV